MSTRNDLVVQRRKYLGRPFTHAEFELVRARDREEAEALVESGQESELSTEKTPEPR